MRSEIPKTVRVLDADGNLVRVFSVLVSEETVVVPCIGYVCDPAFEKPDTTDSM